MLVGESLEKIAILLIDESPLGAHYYASKQGNIENDIGYSMSDTALFTSVALDTIYLD